METEGERVSTIAKAHLSVYLSAHLGMEYMHLGQGTRLRARAPHQNMACRVAVKWLQIGRGKKKKKRKSRDLFSRRRVSRRGEHTGGYCKGMGN